MQFINAKMIWESSTHDAFTDLIKFEKHWYCVFREASDHMSMDGKLRVIRSKKGKKWKSIAIFSYSKGDIRDGKFSITSSGDLMLNAGVRLHEAIEGTKSQSITYFSKDGESWSELYSCENTSLGTWRWSTTWYDKTAYSIGYTGRDKKGCLYSSNDGKNWQILKNNLFPLTNSYSNESSIVFKDDELYCLLRRDEHSYSSFLGVAKAPYTTWEWNDLGVPIGGPKMIYVKKLDKFISVVRLYGNKSARTSICEVDTLKGEIKELMCLPSGGDTSYAGVVLEDDVLWISYYSSHEGKTSVYLSKVKI